MAATPAKAAHRAAGPKTARPTRAYIAFLRGINVGGNNMLPMKDLTALFTAADCSTVRTYIQSGNVVYDAPDAVAERVADAVRAAIKKKFGLDVAIVTRTADELASVAGANPYLARSSADPNQGKALHVAFLASAPPPDCVAKLDPARSPPDEFTVIGREVYLYYPNGQGRSKLGNDYLERCLATKSTVRNWNTILKLVELSREDRI